MQLVKQNIIMFIASISARLCWDEKPSGAAFARATCVGALIAALLLLLSWLLFAMLGAAHIGGLAGAPVFERGSIAIFFAAVIWAPLFETLIGQTIPIAGLIRFGAPHSIAIVTSAMLFSAGHMALGGGLAQGMITLVGGLCFASVFAANMRGSFARAFGLTATAHASSNALVLLLSFGLGF